MKHLASIGLALALSITLNAQVPSNLKALEGESARYIDQDMEKYGYTHIKTSKSNYSSYTYWWKEKSRKCVCVRTYDGRVASVAMSMPFDCNKDTGGDLDEAFERGFADGLHHKTYHNTYHISHSEEEAYARGYSKGVAQRTLNTSHYADKGDYESHVKVMDLVNAEPQWAYDKLRSRGFKPQRHHNSNHKTYNVWNNSKTGQCILSIATSERILKIENSTRCY